jgi:lipoprotein-anchoring transpeptidase ErfK/SrfK
VTAENASPADARRAVVRPALAAIFLAALVASASSIAASPKHSSRTVSMTNSVVAHWAPIVSDVLARSAPARGASAVLSVSTVTGEGTQNIVLILARMSAGGATWYRVLLASLPNSMTGWVPASALGNVYAVRTHLYVDRETFTATLKRNGRTIFTTRIGVGKSYWPTPAGQFYIRDKLTNFDNPFYGPVAFGTSARSTVLTDWPGGGYVGVHGTNAPDILPGAVSHGCIRMRNTAILRLAKLMPVGTPLTVS